jgi:hypothetical protein
MEHITSYLDEHKDVGIVQGIIYDVEKKYVDNAGFYMTESLSIIPVKTPPSNPIYVTYASGSYMIVRRELISRLGVPFDWFGFMYFDDMPLGFKAWSMKFKVVSLPIEAGRHVGSASGRMVSEKTTYYYYRGLGILTEVSNTRYKRQLKNMFVKDLPVISGIRNRQLLSAAIKGFIDGLRLGAEMRGQGYHLDIYSAPLITDPKYNSLSLILPSRLLPIAQGFVADLMAESPCETSARQ